MNLHQIAGSVICSVNPQVPANLRINVGTGDPGPDGKRLPIYATPGTLTAALANGVMTVSAVGRGKLLAGQTVTSEDGSFTATILSQTSGDPGGAGVYAVTGTQTLAEQLLETTLVVPAQVQAMTFRDLQQVEALNLQGTRRGIYFYGRVEGLVRPENKGGDLVALPDGSVWLVALVLEHWPEWTKVAATLQNNG